MSRVKVEETSSATEPTQCIKHAQQCQAVIHGKHSRTPNLIMRSEAGEMIQGKIRGMQVDRGENELMKKKPQPLARARNARGLVPISYVIRGHHRK